MGLGVQVMSEDFELQIKIAVYSSKGEFIMQHNGSSLSDETIQRIKEELLNNA